MSQATSDAPSNFTSQTTPSFIPYPVAASTTIYKGRPVCINASGLAVQTTASAGLRFVGFAQRQADNSAGAAGAISVNVTPAQAPDAQYYDLAAVGAAQSWVGQVVYWVDDQTVALSASNSVTCGVVTSFLSSTLVTVNTAQRA